MATPLKMSSKEGDRAAVHNIVTRLEYKTAALESCKANYSIVCHVSTTRRLIIWWHILLSTPKNHQPPVQIKYPLQHKITINKEAATIKTNLISLRFSTITPSLPDYSLQNSKTKVNSPHTIRLKLTISAGCLSTRVVNNIDQHHTEPSMF